MRELKVYNLNSTVGRMRTYIEMKSTMIWPNEEEARRRYCATMALRLREFARGNIHADGPTSGFVDDWLQETGGPLIVANFSATKDHGKCAIKALLSWIIVGSMLDMLYRMECNHSDLRGGASINKVTYLAEHNAPLIPPQDRRRILARWSEFKDVAHLCVYIFHIMMYTVGVNWNDDPDRLGYWFEIRLRSDLLTFLSTARHYQQFGLNHYSQHGRKESALDPAKTWRIPEGLKLPAPLISEAPLRGELLERLKKYNAPLLLERLKNTNPLQST